MSQQSEAGYQSPGGSSQPANSDAQQFLQSFWQRVTDDINLLVTNDFKQQELPLARIKKIMKLDEDVKMISAEAPVLFAKAAEMFVTELSLRAWIHTEDNKRRTLQRNDIAMAITKFDQFDFLIDIVPRDELKPPKRQDESVRTTTMLPEQVQYYFQLAQQQQNPQQQGPTQIQILQPGGQVQTASAQTVQAIASPPTTVQVQTQGAEGQQNVQVTQAATTVAPQLQVQSATATHPQLIQIQQQSPVQNQVAQQAQNQGGIQLIQQIVTNTGEIQQIPIQLTQAQLQLIRMQMQGQGTNQPIIIQASPIQATAASPQQVQQQGTQAVYQIQQVAQQSQGQGPTPVFLTSTQGQQTIQIQQIATQDQGNGIEDQSQ